MAIGAALKDRGHIVRKEATAKRVEGRTTFVAVAKPEFKCRLEIKKVPESKDEGGNVSYTSTPLLMTGRRDKEHNLLEFQVDDYIEITSKDMPQFNGVYQVDGLAEPMRKKRRVLGWMLTLAAVDESAFSRAAA